MRKTGPEKYKMMAFNKKLNKLINSVLRIREKRVNRLEEYFKNCDRACKTVLRMRENRIKDIGSYYRAEIRANQTDDVSREKGIHQITLAEGRRLSA